MSEVPRLERSSSSLARNPYQDYPLFLVLTLTSGTTRDNFDGKPVKDLQYTSYAPRALKTMLEICKSISTKHAVTSIAMIHRLGTVPICEESILIAVSTPHRQAAWRAGEEALELCKEKVEVWKLEEFVDGSGAWRANRDGKSGVSVDKEELQSKGGQVEGILGTEGIPKLGQKPPRPADGKPVFAMPSESGGKLAPTGDASKPRSSFEKGHGPVKHADTEKS